MIALPRRALVTGGSGFIGRHVVRALLRRGVEVRCGVEPGTDPRLTEGLGAEVVNCDVTCREQVRDALRGCDGLFHLAAIYRLWGEDDTPVYRVNVEGTQIVMAEAQAAGVARIVFTSSIAAIGTASEGLADESTSFNLGPIANAYIMSKWLSERLVLNLAACGAPIVVVNPSFPFGPEDYGPTPTGNMLAALLRGQVPFTSAGGISIIDVEDCAEGHVLAYQRGRVGERYILTQHNVSLVEFFARAAALAGVRAPLLRAPRALAVAAGAAFELWADHISHAPPRATRKSVQYATTDAYFSNAKALRELELPQRSLDETLRRALDWLVHRSVDRCVV
jgi:dihydroflavonol-4-reductase